MADEAGVMFAATGKATPLLIGRWKAKGAVTALPPAAVLVQRDNTATETFTRLWRAAFPDRRALPPGMVARPDGRFSDAMLNVWL
jgi:hypothetical protein